MPCVNLRPTHKSVQSHALCGEEDPELARFRDGGCVAGGFELFCSPFQSFVEIVGDDVGIRNGCNQKEA